VIWHPHRPAPLTNIAVEQGKLVAFDAANVLRTGNAAIDCPLYNEGANLLILNRFLIAGSALAMALSSIAAAADSAPSANPNPLEVARAFGTREQIQQIRAESDHSGSYPAAVK
jgi:hypothetical protein